MDGTDIRSASKSLAAPFLYEEAFSRNLGWLLEWEQQALRHKRVAIAGLGGVGGSHLLTLTRLGIGAFHIADPDRFEIANFNRQVGANLSSIGRPKIDVLAEQALQINPELRIARYHQGVNPENIDEFLNGVDLFVDALDFFALDIRRKVTARCLERKIPVVNAAPLGMGTAFLIFRPGGMDFEQWFQLRGLSDEHQYVSYLLGMAPAGLNRSYLVDPGRVDLKGHSGPSTAAACELCAGVASVEAIKLLLGREDVKAVPYYHQFDAYRGRWISRKLPRGNRSLAQRFKIALSRRLAAKLSAEASVRPKDFQPRTELEKILNHARWAPSGDNIQPWRFQIIDDLHILVYVTCPGDIYDYNDGEPTLLSAGFLLETIKIAASSYGRSVTWNYVGCSGGRHEIAVTLTREEQVQPDPLLSFVTLRSVDRRAYRPTSLTDSQKSTLVSALGGALTVEWYESFNEKRKSISVGSLASDIRLRIPDTFDIHRKVIDWDHRFSPMGIPGTAIGLDPAARRLTRWLMQKRSRLEYANRLLGTALARLEMDVIPGFFSGAHFKVSLRNSAEATPTPPVLLAAGQSLQRFWLTAESLSLAIQPNLAPLCFAYQSTGKNIQVSDRRLRHKISRLVSRLAVEPQNRPLFLGRIGMRRGRRTSARSTRLALSELIIE